MCRNCTDFWDYCVNVVQKLREAMSCTSLCLNRQDIGERQNLKFAQQVEWGIGKNILVVSPVPGLVDIIFSVGNSSAVLSRLILSPISQLPLVAGWKQITSLLSYLLARETSPITFLNWGKRKPFHGRPAGFLLLQMFWEYLLFDTSGGQNPFRCLRQVQGVLSIATCRGSSNENEANLPCIFFSLFFCMKG